MGAIPLPGAGTKSADAHLREEVLMSTLGVFIVMALLMGSLYFNLYFRS
ncbi:MAG: hypothetical protein RRB13_11550 [bacterium]|nr:hypothetical protein [bacterium]